MISSLLNMQFAHPYFLWAIPVLIFLFALWLYFRYRKDKAAMTLSNTQMFDNYVSWKSRFLVMLPFSAINQSLFDFLVALARPQSSSTDQKISSYGIDMVISMDISSSMLAQDFKPNRLEAAKDVASRFIQNRPSDRIGLVVFAGESFIAFHHYRS
ncbi:MAG: VWA domain-containing protein [Chitinophagales bacterium]